MIRPPDQEARTTAWQCFDKNIAVTAGAGTGKTRVLVDRHLGWILGEAWTRPTPALLDTTPPVAINSRGFRQPRVASAVRTLYVLLRTPKRLL